MTDDDFAGLLSSEQERLRRIIRAVVFCGAATGDILQRSNLVAWEKRNTFVHGTNFRKWINTIVRYEILAHRRDKIRRKETVLSEQAEEKLFVTEDANDSDEIAKALQGCLQALREEDRVLLRNRYSGKNTLRAYAEEAGRSEAGIRVSLHRLRKALKACVEAKIKNEQG